MSQIIPYLPIAIGIITAIVALIYSARVRGSVIGGVLQSFGLGILIGVFAMIIDTRVWIDPKTQESIHDALLIISYLFMILAVWRVRHIA